MELAKASDLLSVHGELPHRTSVGGYGLTYIGKHFDDVLCADCVNTWTKEAILENVEGAFVHWEGQALTCDGCNCEIESEYGDPEDDE